MPDNKNITYGSVCSGIEAASVGSVASRLPVNGSSSLTSRRSRHTFRNYLNHQHRRINNVQRNSTFSTGRV